MRKSNIVHKQIIDINCYQNVDGISLQKTTEDFCKFKLQPRLESLLDQYNWRDHYILIDELLIEVNVGSEEFGETLLTGILSQLETLLDNKIADTRKDKLPVLYADRFVETLAFYLTNGYLPWWVQVKNSGEWQKNLKRFFSETQSNANWGILKTAIKTPIACERLLAELTEGQVWRFIELVSDFSVDELKGIKEDVRRLTEIIPGPKKIGFFPGSVQNILMVFIATQSQQEPITLLIIKNLYEELRKVFVSDYSLLKKVSLRSDLFQIVLNKLLSETRFKQEKLPIPKLPHRTASLNFMKSHVSGLVESAKVDVRPSIIVDLDLVEIYIGNAGLCLLAPYLPGFFRNLSLIKEDKILNLNKAVSLLNFMVDSSKKFADFEVLLPKIFCGAGLDTVSQRFRLSAEDKKQCHDLINAVITNWGVLKNTSIEGLQKSFLQRDGKLSRRQDNWLLTVEQRPYDMLLKQLPWSINMIRHTWMKEMVLVEWV